ncbi:ATP-dependent Clp protease ATP-binding subunit [Alkalicoccus daliensis]|uniref:ATP-dependent Clp protease ATP-binding subunit ClpE n=1 Tax=Alkalicoccus daliensis TaxID=745820 RepID=A0A1H0JLR7_9BACI|nr:ATP-dependent Clp protease ATP-binding subunit [Alkalicoccus daliensis]SDO44666.1 ATP-dependent Clp protease ATP-binding subunit ClpE [Alkalicoccus daliensis]
MKCQNCNIREASINVRLQYNQQAQHVKLCKSCFEELQSAAKNHAGNPAGVFKENMMNQFGGSSDSEAAQPGQSQKSQSLLDELASNLSNAANAGLIDPVIGRDQEVKRVTEILNRRTKNNPVLIGEPGVGKTAIAEGLALKISKGDVPSKLLNKEIYLLDVASLVANTGVRGQFEEKLKQLTAELKERKNVLLFIDEIHQIVGAGKTEGSMDAGNILKPALARGELQVIGATTLKEYRNIEKDGALERRFQPVMVNEPALEEAMEILKGLQSKYEDYHEVTYSEEALQACVTLSHRYIQDRFLPDKAIDLMDEAGAKMNLESGDTSHKEVEERLARIAKQKEEVLQKEDYETAAKLRDEEEALEKKLEQEHSAEKKTIEAENIQKIVEKMTGIPVGKLQDNEASKMKRLAEHISGSVIGQEEAVQKVAKAVRRSRAGLKPKHRPIGSFLFVGPTGVGKTELSKTLAKEMFGSSEAMHRLDMSEYMEKHAVSKLIGSPPGYVGHEEAGQLTEKVRRNPYSIILLDEIEKAHPDVQHMFLQIMEDGRLTDSQGRTVSFKDTVIIMTSNAGSGAAKQRSIGFSESESLKEESMLENLSSYFKPEFLNRFDAIIEFNHLDKTHLVKIVDLMLEELQETLTEQEITIHISEEAKEKIAELGYHKEFGARPLRRAIQHELEDKITELILDQEVLGEVEVVVEKEEIQLKQRS